MKERNRKQRKARWMRFKSAYRRHPDCVHGAVFCDHVYEEQRPWQWVDFRFPSLAHRRRYYAVAARTLEYTAITDAEDRAWDKVDELLPYPQKATAWVPVIDKMHGRAREWPLSKEVWQLKQERAELHKKLFLELSQRPVKLCESIEVRLEYGPVAIGLWVQVNKSYLDPSWFDEFICWYLAQGEPLKQGVVWEGEGVEIVPAEIYRSWSGER